MQNSKVVSQYLHLERSRKESADTLLSSLRFLTSFRSKMSTYLLCFIYFIFCTVLFKFSAVPLMHVSGFGLLYCNLPDHFDFCCLVTYRNVFTGVCPQSSSQLLVHCSACYGVRILLLQYFFVLKQDLYVFFGRL